MELMDIDEVIEQTRKSVKLLRNLDVEDKFAATSINRIVTDILEEAEKITLDNTPIADRTSVPYSPYINTGRLQALKKIDSQLRKTKLYERHIRPRIQPKAEALRNRKVIDGKLLLQYDGEELIDILYRSILMREPDEDGKQNAIKFLVESGNNKTDLIYSLLNSEEAKRNGHYLRVSGLWNRKILIKIKRILYSIPVIGYLIQWVVNLILLPKRYQSLAIKNNELSMSLDKSLKEISDRFDLKYNNQVNELNKNINILNEILDKDVVKIEEQSEIIKRYTLENEVLNQKVQELEAFHNEIIRSSLKAKQNLSKEKEIFDKFYLRYNEVLMPDTREEVKSRAKIYIDKLNEWANGKNKDKLELLDLGCGECEWIELLGENGFKAKGVDSNEYVVNKVKSELPNIKIYNDNALSYLNSMEDNSIDLISSFHMVEHMEMLDIIKLISESRRVLKSGGMLIIETPNPLNILTETYYFNLDPTHKKPIPPELLQFYVSECGFQIKEKLLLNPLNFIPYEYKDGDPIKDIVFRFNMEQAYSILAVKE